MAVSLACRGLCVPPRIYLPKSSLTHHKTGRAERYSFFFCFSCETVFDDLQMCYIKFIITYDHFLLCKMQNKKNKTLLFY